MTGDKGSELYLSLFNLKGIISKDKEAEAEAAQAAIEEKELLLRLYDTSCGSTIFY